MELAELKQLQAARYPSDMGYRAADLSAYAGGLHISFSLAYDGGMPLFIWSPESEARLKAQGIAPFKPSPRFHALMWLMGPLALLMGLSYELVPDLNALGQGPLRELLSLLAIPGLEPADRSVLGRSYLEALALSAGLFGLAYQHYLQPGRWHYWIKDTLFSAVPFWVIFGVLHSLGVPTL